MGNSANIVTSGFPVIQSVNNLNFNTIANYKNDCEGSFTNTTALKILKIEGCENLATYLEMIGLAKDRDLILLPSKHHYFYEAEELMKVQTVVNLKELNLIKKVREFMNSIFHTLPHGCNFVGFFSENKELNRFYSLIDPKNQNSLSKHSTYSLLREYGFMVKDMTKINNHTYFHSQKIRMSDN